MTQTTAYRQLPGGPAPDVYAARLSTCRTCAHQTAGICRPANQLTTILARLPAARCPAGQWADQTPTPAAPTAPLPHHNPDPLTAADRCAVAIICHNQGQFLAEGVRSVFWQTAQPAEVLIINAASTDHTATLTTTDPDIARARTIHTPSNNLAAARHLAYQETTAEFLCCLDADDVLGPTYLADGIHALDRHPSAAIAWTDLTQFGDATGPLALSPGNLNSANWIHSGSITRRAALDQLSPRDAWPAQWNNLAHHDWRLWRTILRNGWTAVHSPAKYYYRRHAASLTAQQRAAQTPWPTLADLDNEPVEMLIACSGRPGLLERLYPLLIDTATTHPGRLSLRLAVTTPGPFLADLADLARQACLANLIDGFTLYQHHVGPDHLADADRHNQTNYRAVQIAMSRLYSRALAETQAEYLWILEDDITPPAGALQRMLHGFLSPAVASVALPYRSRFQDAFVAWHDNGEPYRTRPANRLSPVGGNGFGCTVLRRTYFNQIPIRADRLGNFDPNFYADLRDLGGVSLVDWSTTCQHQ